MPTGSGSSQHYTADSLVLPKTMDSKLASVDEPRASDVYALHIRRQEIAIRVQLVRGEVFNRSDAWTGGHYLSITPKAESFGMRLTGVGEDMINLAMPLYSLLKERHIRLPAGGVQMLVGEIVALVGALFDIAHDDFGTEIQAYSCGSQSDCRRRCMSALFYIRMVGARLILPDDPPVINITLSFGPVSWLSCISNRSDPEVPAMTTPRVKIGVFDGQSGRLH